MERVDQLRRMNEYPPWAYRLANLIEARPEAVMYFKLERTFLNFFDLPVIFGGGLKPMLLPLFLFGLFEAIRRLVPKTELPAKKKQPAHKTYPRIEWVALSLIILLASFLYFYKVGQLPNSLSDDETAVGYNAYSILNTGKDEFGKSFPIAFRFFGAYTPPLFVYLIVPVIKLFGLSAAAIRTPSGVATILGIVVVYFFIKKLGLFKSYLTAIVGAFIFAISPWVIYYARVGYEITFGYIIFSLGALLLWSGLAKNRMSLVGLALLSTSTYIAHTERFLVMIFLLLVLVLFRKNIFLVKNKKSIIWGAIVLITTQVPNFYLATTKSFWVKSAALGYNNIGLQINDFVIQLLTYFSPKAIFGPSPDINLQHTAPEIGLFYSWLIVPFFLGLYQLYIKLKTPGGKFLAILLLTAPIPGALSGHFISIQRVMTLIIPLTLVIALGFDFILQKVNPKIFVPLLLVLSAFSLLLFWRSYFVLFPKERFPYWSYGYQQLSEIVKSSPDEHYVIDSSRAGTVYIGLLFYLRYPPEQYQRQFSPDVIKRYYDDPSISVNHSFANLELRPVVWEKDIFIEQILVGDALAISIDQMKEHFLTQVFQINDPNGKAILFGYRTDPEKKKADNLAKQKRKLGGRLSR